VQGSPSSDGGVDRDMYRQAVGIVTDLGRRSTGSRPTPAGSAGSTPGGRNPAGRNPNRGTGNTGRSHELGTQSGTAAITSLINQGVLFPVVLAVDTLIGCAVAWAVGLMAANVGVVARARAMVAVNPVACWAGGLTSANAHVVRADAVGSVNDRFRPVRCG